MNPVQSRSILRLLATFLVALLFAGIIRIGLEVWASNKLFAIGSKAGVSIEYGELNLVGWFVRFRNVSVESNRLPTNLIFDQVEISPAWGALFKGDAALRVELHWQGVDASATVSEEGATISVQNIRAEAEAEKLLATAAPFLYLPPLQAGGSVNLEGDVQLNRVTGLPEAGALQLRWQGANAGVMGAEFALGDLTLRLQSEATRWVWSLDDAGVGFVHGEGALMKQAGQMGFWPIGGRGVVNVTKLNDPTLLAWVPNPAADGSVQFELSGTLANPRVVRLN